jgi:hypothetical protein
MVSAVADTATKSVEKTAEKVAENLRKKQSTKLIKYQ